MTLPEAFPAPDLFQAWVEEAQKVWGDTVYVYYALPITWSGRGRASQHTTPITGLEHHKISKEEWEANRAESKRQTMEAFMGRLKYSYTRYERRVAEPGWVETLAKVLKERT